MALTNVREFTLSLSRRPEEARERHAQRTKAAALYALGSVVLGTRVDTGRARGNWQVTEGEPAIGYDPARFDQAGRLGNMDALSEGQAAVLNTSGRDIIWLHNGVPYIGVLEDMDKMVAGTVEATRTWLASRPANAGGSGAGGFRRSPYQRLEPLA